MKTIRRGKQKTVFTYLETERDILHSNLLFFHKFGLVRFSFDPGVLTPGFSFYASFFLKYSTDPLSAMSLTFSTNAIRSFSLSLAKDRAKAIFSRIKVAFSFPEISTVTGNDHTKCMASLILR